MIAPLGPCKFDSVEAQLDFDLWIYGIAIYSIDPVTGNKIRHDPLTVTIIKKPLLRKAKAKKHG